MKILVIDDDTVNLLYICGQLKNEDYEVLEAVDGEAAWQCLTMHPDIKLIICDRILPKLSGIQLTTKLRQTEHLKKIPIIMMTGLAEKEEVCEAITAGVNDFLYKPIDQELLLLTVKRLIKTTGS